MTAATIKATGEKVYILIMDSDPACLVWVVYADNTDRDAMVSRDDLY